MQDATKTIRINDCGLAEFLDIAAGFGTNGFGFVVTPNVDHLIRYNEDATFRDIYQRADFVLMDSRFLAGVLKLMTGLQMPTCPGSDLTAGLFESVIGPADDVLLIGGTASQAASLRKTYDIHRLRHYNPPMGFVDVPHELEACLRFIEQSGSFRYCFLAVGSPQQERVAYLLKLRGHARGLVLCVGGAINFLTGVERRAPVWIQHVGFEWLFRLVRDPWRLARRYLIRGPRILLLLPTLQWKLVGSYALERGGSPAHAGLEGGANSRPSHNETETPDDTLNHPEHKAASAVTARQWEP